MFKYPQKPSVITTCITEKQIFHLFSSLFTWTAHVKILGENETFLFDSLVRKIWLFVLDIFRKIPLSAVFSALFNKCFRVKIDYNYNYTLPSGTLVLNVKPRVNMILMNTGLKCSNFENSNIFLEENLIKNVVWTKVQRQT